MFPASQTWVLIPNVWYSGRIQNVRIYWISGLIWIITIGLWRLWWQNIKRAKWKYSRGEQYSAAQIVEQSFWILNRFMKLISFDTCSNEIVSYSIGKGEYQWANATGVRRYANKTSQELRMLSRSLSDCKSLLLNLNLSLNRCLCSDCSDCSVTDVSL